MLDTSGSMQGFPIEKAKETMKLALDSLYPSDTFNLITFAGDTQHTVSETGAGNTREPEKGAGVSQFAIRRRRHRDDDGDQGSARTI